jgi:hypothetical protein
MTQQTTEWEDILRDKGIIPELTKEKLEEIVDQGRLCGVVPIWAKDLIEALSLLVLSASETFFEMWSQTLLLLSDKSLI